MTLGCLLCVVCGALWGGWLGQREAAHGGIGLGLLGLVGGLVLGAALGLGVHSLGVVLGLSMTVVVLAFTVVVVERW